MATGSGPGDGVLWEWTRGVRELRWGLKRSFLDYLSGMADFDLSMGQGARALPQEQAFSFPVAEAGGDAQGRVLRFAGELGFTAHLGALRVIIAEPWLERGPGGVRLTVARPEEWGPGPARLALADLRPAGVVRQGEWVVARFGAALAADGVAMFAGVYVPGESFEPVVVVARPEGGDR